MIDKKEHGNVFLFNFEANRSVNGAPTYRKNEHGNIQGKSTGIVLRGGIAAVGL